jgi:hypothetical protein
MRMKALTNRGIDVTSGGTGVMNSRTALFLIATSFGVS